ARPEGVPVTTVAVAKRDVPMRMNYPGIVTSPRGIQLVARVAGFLLKQGIADGAVTKPGDVIYRIDPRQYEAAVLAAEGKLAEATAQRNYAKLERDRNEPLVKQNAISQQTFDDLVTKYESAQGQVEVAQAQLVNAKLDLSYCTVSSPFAGVLGPSAYFEGAVVGEANTRNLNTLVQIDPMWVQFSPSSKEWPRFQELMAKGSVPVQLTTDGDRPAKASGRLIFADNQVSTSTSTLMLRAEFPNASGAFRPGAYANVTVDIGDLGDCLVLPERAAFARLSDIFVWRVKSDDTVESISIKPIKVEDGQLAFTSTLQVGDRIVVDGIQRLKAGSKIIDTGAQAAKPAPAAPAATGAAK
ncbi:MAG: efflux RND transporter periplasmic adaptor subunit, partial [Planctomycetota bacterium]